MSQAPGISLKGITTKSIFLISLLCVSSIGFWKIIGNRFELFGILALLIAFYLTNLIMKNTLSAKWGAPIVALFLGIFLGFICGVAETNDSVKSLVPIALTATLIVPLSLIIFIHIYAANTPERLFVDSSKLVKYIILLVSVDCISTALIGHYQFITFNNQPTSYFLSFLFIIIGCVIFLFNINDIRDQLENKAPKNEEWTDAFLLMISTFWIFIAVFFFAGRTRKS